MASDFVKKLLQEGWNLLAEKLEEAIPGFGNLGLKSALEEIKNSDLKHIGVPSIPDDLAKVSENLVTYIKRKKRRQAE